MANIPGINVAGMLVPFTDQDTYPITDPTYGIGGWREVVDIAARDAIPAERLRQGMVVVVQGGQVYMYNGSGWDPINSVVRVASSSVPASSSAAGVAGTLAVSGTTLYVCYATNSWAKIALDLTPF